MTDTTYDENDGALFALNLSPSHLLHRAQQFAANQSAAALRDAGITLRQFSVLAAIAESEGASQAKLVDATGIDRSTLADMVGRMEKSGLIDRPQSADDARAKAVSLTHRGREALAKAAPAVREADEKLLAALPKNRRGSFIDILATLTEAGERQPEARPPAPEEAPAKKAKVKAKAKAKPKAKAKAKDTKAKPKKKKRKKAKTS